ncbi:hypothetical protein N657DRAFT_672597 [Parathielavia appendiculata]|uniref:Uncharacterized protein n=1 Tax=Parathielavia appendiculata TaxID=2587402 RepID=A0AAN6TYB0_9PEZI|nr:hypothetical protein N657DRAFT_672597 [Parathielavia appendiculata]
MFKDTRALENKIQDENVRIKAYELSVTVALHVLFEEQTYGGRTPFEQFDVGVQKQNKTSRQRTFETKDISLCIADLGGYGGLCWIKKRVVPIVVEISDLNGRTHGHIRLCFNALGFNVDARLQIATSRISGHATGLKISGLTRRVKPPDFSEPWVLEFEFNPPLGYFSPGHADTCLSKDVYRHPDRQQRPKELFSKIHDIYALGAVLLEIGAFVESQLQ